MKPYDERGGIRIFHGDAREVLIDLSVNSSVALDLAARAKEQVRD
jgi:hypothetical protein